MEYIYLIALTIIWTGILNHKSSRYNFCLINISISVNGSQQRSFSISVQTCRRGLFHALHITLHVHGVWTCNKWSGGLWDLYEQLLLFVLYEPTEKYWAKFESRQFNLLKGFKVECWRFLETVINSGLPETHLKTCLENYRYINELKFLLL